MSSFAAAAAGTQLSPEPSAAGEPQSYEKPEPTSEAPHEMVVMGNSAAAVVEALPKPTEYAERIDEVDGSKAVILCHGVDDAAAVGPGDIPPIPGAAAFAKGTGSENPALQSFVGNGGPTSRGRGRGGRRGRRGRGRYSNQTPPTSSRAPNPPPAAEVGISAHPQPSIPEIFWCDVCRVECNSIENLKMHENGKRHKKTVARLEEMSTRQRQLAEYETDNAVGTSLTVVSQPKPVNVSQEEAIKQLEMVVKRADEHLTRESSELGSKNATAESGNSKEVADPNQSICRYIVPEKTKLESAVTVPDALLQKVDGQCVTPVVSNKRKKKKAAGQNSKRLKSSEPTERIIPQLKEPPIMCTFCNVTCDTRAVFERHLVGKKHLSRLKQYQGGEMTYGPLGYFPQSNPQVYTHLGVPPVLYGFQSLTVTPQWPQAHHLYVVKDNNAYQQPCEGANVQDVASVVRCMNTTQARVGHDGQNIFAGNGVPEYQPVCPTWNCQSEASVPGQNSENFQLT